MTNTNKKQIIPHLWFDKEAKEAAGFYVDAFGGDSKIKDISTLSNTPSGDVDVVSFKLLGQDFTAISAGPMFKVNPSVSFMVNFDPSKREKAREELDALWAKLSDGGTEFMPLQEYPFSKRYGWIQDKYGISWQLILTNPEGDERPDIIPSLMFADNNTGKAEEATGFYISVFRDAGRGIMARYPAGMEPDKEGTVMFTDFRLLGSWIAAMDSARVQNFSFNEAISLIVLCETQEEIDYYWEKLSAAPEAEQCGWLKDKYGLSWQIVPANFDEMMKNGSPEQIARLTQAFLQMKKFDINKLKEAYDGK